MQRRTFLKFASFAAGLSAHARGANSFKLGAISDSFSEDFEASLKVMGGFALTWVEIRKIYGVYNTEATPAQIARVKELLAKYGFRVSVIDSALYKCTLPGTKNVTGEQDAYPYTGQMELLKRACERAHAVGTDKVRGFTFWRVADPGTLTPRISDELAKAAAVARREAIRLVIENEETCNAATGAELAELLKRTPEPNLGVNWDIGNGYWGGEASYPDGYNALDHRRIWHLHLKGVKCAAKGQNCTETLVGAGENNVEAQLRRLLQDGYSETMSLECEFEQRGLTHQETSKRSLEALLKITGNLSRF